MRWRRRPLRTTQAQKARQGGLDPGVPTRNDSSEGDGLDVLTPEMETGDSPGTSLVYRVTVGITVGITVQQWSRMRRTAQRYHRGTSSLFESAIWRLDDLRVEEPEAFACLIRRHRVNPVKREAEVYVTHAGRRALEEVWQESQRMRPNLQRASLLNLVWRLAEGAGWYDGYRASRPAERAVEATIRRAGLVASDAGSVSEAQSGRRWAPELEEDRTT